MKIYNLIPDQEILINLSIEELAYSLLKVAESNLQNGKVLRDEIISIDPNQGRGSNQTYTNTYEVNRALMEALIWIEVRGLLIPDEGLNGANGWRVFSRQGKKLLDEKHFETYKKSAGFSKEMLHPKISERVWIALARGELADAVFIAFRSVEESVRQAGNYKDTDIGVKLMRNAFNLETGPLSDMNQPEAEREALMHLFAGAIGSYKNPHSHRTVTINDHTEAQEMVMLASHLLRIVDNRARKE